MFLFAPLQAQGLGLGDLRTDSGLNQPLAARVELVRAGKQELEGLLAAVAAPAEFERRGVPYFPIAHLIKVEPVIEDGVAYLRLSTDRAVNEPIIELILVVQSGKDRVTKSYAILLDPVPAPKAERVGKTENEGRPRVGRVYPDPAAG